MLDTTQTSHRWSVHLGSSCRYSGLSRRLTVSGPERPLYCAAVGSMEMDRQHAAKSLDSSPPETRSTTEDRRIVPVVGTEGGTA